MRIDFIGVGEACDEKFPNTAVLVSSGAGGKSSSVLLDCGFCVPWQYWKLCPSPEELDALWISHFHGDHFLGAPALLLRFWEQRRVKPLIIVGQEGIAEKITGAMNLAYPNFLPKLTYQLRFVTAGTGTITEMAGFLWRFAENGHGQRDFAVRLEAESHSVFYSGDGLPTDATLELAHGCDLVIHEAFTLEEPLAGHGTVKQVIQFARAAGAGTVALVHVQRDERRDKAAAIRKLVESTVGLKVILPETGHRIEL